MSHKNDRNRGDRRRRNDGVRPSLAIFFEAELEMARRFLPDSKGRAELKSNKRTRSMMRLRERSIYRQAAEQGVYI